MKQIHKTSEPFTLKQYRSSITKEHLEDSNIYEDFKAKTKEGCIDSEKGNLRKQLLEEQGYICCYCMSPISCKNSKIEHYKPQTKYRSLQIDYQNLFVSCQGGEGLRKKEQFCDTYKGEDELHSIDLLQSIEHSIGYQNEKRRYICIVSDNSQIDSEINSVLNLNAKILKENRYQEYNRVKQKLQQQNFSAKSIKETIKYYSQKHNGKYEPYAPMIIYFLTKKLKAQGVQQ